MNILIVGGGSGIGSAMIAALRQEASSLGFPVTSIHATWHHHQPDPTEDTPHNANAKLEAQAPLRWHPLDVTDEQAIAQLAHALPPMDWIVNTVGMLHDATQQPEKAIAQWSAEQSLRSFTINTMPTLTLAKHFHPHFKRSQRPLMASISARVGSIGENHLGGWYSYRISKCALNMALRTLAVEWQRSLPKGCVAALHPGTTDTRLSRPFQKNVPGHKLFTPQRTADQLWRILARLTPEQSGRFWSWDGSELPW